MDTRTQALNEIRGCLNGGLLRGMGGPKQPGRPRTLADELLEKPITVVFGMAEGAMEFDIYPKSHLEADEWRIAALAVVQQMRPILMKDFDLGAATELLKSGESLLDLFVLFVDGTIPALAELVFEWEPTLDRDLILRDLRATDSQIATAFLACCQLAFPFSSTLKGISRLIQGSQAKDQEVPTEPSET